MPELEGRRIGNYQLHRLLGKGSFAHVYLGEHLYLRSSAAIKILYGLRNEKDEQLFLSEAQTIAQLAHPNIVRVREFAIERSTPFLAMDYAPGGTLRHRYPTGSCLSLEKTVTYVKHIAAALQYAHNRGIIHRDVKPENVLQGPEHAMLSDFGISVQAPKPNTLTSQEWAGTFSYMAPEQFLGKAVFASDQYALAILAYEWLCGVRPFEGSSTGLAYQHGNVPPPRLRDKDPSLPEAVEVVILKALSKQPEERYVSIINFARALERACRDTSYDIQTNAATESLDAPHPSAFRSVFLSHAPSDDITRLQRDLTIRDISVQNDSTPAPQEGKTRQAIRAAQVVLLVLTPQTDSSAAVKDHVRIAGLYRRSILCVWAQGDALQDLLPAGAEQATIIDSRGQRYQQAIDEIIISLEREHRGATTVEAPLPALDFEPRNPYKGLRAFTQNDRADFFGRQADFYDRPFAYPELGRLVQQQQCAIMPMSIEDLRDVIERPALLPDVRLLFDEDLVGDLLVDMHGQAGALPLLEFALDQLFEHRRERRLTRYAYQEIGGVRGALSKHAESTYAALPSEEHRRLARMLFMRLIQTGAQGQEPMRRRADAPEFVLESAEQTHILQAVIDTFVAARLITINQFIAMSVLEISHEALIREWSRLATWQQEARADMHLQQAISNDVLVWEQRGKPKNRLYRGSQLEESLAWQERNTASGNEAAFLRASTARRARGRITMLLAVLMLFALLIPLGVLLQQQYALPTVTTLKDDAPGSLRQVIANARPGSTVIFDSSLKGTITLNKTLVISKDLTLRGPGVNQLTLRGTRDQGSLIDVPHHSTVTISQLTFSDPTPATGPIIRNEGTLTLDNCHITGNTQMGFGSAGKTEGGGGGIQNNSGVLTLQNSIVSHNTVTANTGSGGGISSANGTLIIKNSQIVDNTMIASGPVAGGGGISSTESKITLINTLIARNRVTGGQNTSVFGGGIFSGKDTITLVNSSITNNRVEGNAAKEPGIAVGGGMVSTQSTLTIRNSQISGNTIVSKNKAIGGAIYSNNSQMIIDKSMFSNNSTTGNSSASGGAFGSVNGRVIITGTTIAHNTLKSLRGIASGGGIYSEDTLAITDSIVSENRVSAFTADTAGATGGGIDTQGTLTLQRTTISLNTVTNSKGGAVGGGFFAYEPDTTKANALFQFTNCTIISNKAQARSGARGGGLDFSIQGPHNSSIDFCTIYGNIASQGGGIATDWIGASIPPDLSIRIKNSIVAGNVAGTAPDISGPVTTGGYNLVQRSAGAFVNDPMEKHKTDLSGDRYPNLGIEAQLGNHGGPTPTVALQASSPAVNSSIYGSYLSAPNTGCNRRSGLYHKFRSISYTEQ
jgi:serine/threonine protein kinase